MEEAEKDVEEVLPELLRVLYILRKLPSHRILLLFMYTKSGQNAELIETRGFDGNECRLSLTK